MIFNMVLTHGVPTESLILSTLVSIPQNKRCNNVSKAFDKVEYHQLRDRNMCPIILRLLRNIYNKKKFNLNAIMLCN